MKAERPSLVGLAVDGGTGLVAKRIEHYTNLAREISDVLRDRGEPLAADAVQALSKRGTEVARYLRSSDGTQIWNDAQEFARKRTWLLTGVGLASGVVLARMIRSASTYRGGWEHLPDYRDAYAQPYRPQTGRFTS
jgi:hypothetical protein